MMHASKLAGMVLEQDMMRGYYIQSGVRFEIADREAYRRRFMARAVAALGNMMAAPAWDAFVTHADLASERMSLSMLYAFSFFKRDILAKCIEVVAHRLQRGDRVLNPFAMVLSLAGSSRRALCAQERWSADAISTYKRRVLGTNNRSAPWTAPMSSRSSRA